MIKAFQTLYMGENNQPGSFAGDFLQDERI